MKQKKVTIKMNIGNPKYNVGDKVICPLAGEGVLTIAPGTFHNGFTWMYYFEENECGCGGEYISPAPAATPSPLPEAETGVSIDTPTEAEMYSDVWEWDDAQKKKPAPPTPGNERQEGGSEEVQRKLTMALREVMEDLKHMACNYGGYSFEETKKNYYGKIASYANAKAILNSITGGK